MPPVISSVWTPRSFLSSRYMPSEADTVPTPIWTVSPSLISSAATSVQITSTAATSSSLSGGAAPRPSAASASTTHVEPVDVHVVLAAGADEVLVDLGDHERGVAAQRAGEPHARARSCTSRGGRAARPARGTRRGGR